ncbi:protein NRT1/ PTR FAMILY 1.2-like isoform X1 [Chenopodium quinoa]|uniref:protein NRT1/ PTR FAMILY 1.2-like isoform X1 n=2 Tax=Chenopodium quinoa TaxID=63459 RepID=UPI000B77BA65|nr:protein NRT1/ PTR FAMILY 1.2-like isoform X1 [Chenopodium quinoa]
MADESLEQRLINEHQQEETFSKRNKASFITLPFIIANESFEKVASYGLTTNMIVYLMNDYKMSLAKGQNLLFLWTAAINFLPIVGAFVADSYLGRFLTIGVGSIFSLLGMIMLWMTTIIPEAKTTAGPYALLLSSFLFIAIGAGGVRPCSLAFGADQIDQRENHKNRTILETFFNWYYACGCFSVVIAMTVIVYIQDHWGWTIGFGVPVILMFLSTLFLFLAAPYYVMNQVKRSLFISLIRVAVAAFRNRKMNVQPLGSSVHQYYHEKDSTVIVPSDKLRCLNKACIIQDRDQDIGPDGLAKNPWTLCTVEEVEELKSLIRVLPIWSTGVIMSIHASQSSFGLLQAESMDRHLGPNFEVPAASFITFSTIVIVFWIPIYDRVLLPLASWIYGKPVTLSVKLRMGIGLFCAFMSMLVAGIVENVRRERAIAQGFVDSNGQAVLMSAFWLVPQYIFSGLAEAFNAIGQNEFFYTEMPKSMSSIATCLFGVGMAVANLLASLIFNLVNDITKREEESWVSSDVNKGHYDYYYWFLATICSFNMLYYMICSWCYGPVAGEV